MRILVTGSTGFVGRRLCRYLLDQGHRVTALGRSPSHPCQDHDAFDYVIADTTEGGSWQEAVGTCQAAINLAGANIFRRWSPDAKRTIRDSRILTTRNLVQALPTGPDVFLFSASGIGYYGDCGDQLLTEDASPGNDFLARLAIDWEQEALNATSREVRVAIGRFGVILHHAGGALSKMLPAFKMGVGGPLGSGNQWFPWIHLRDVIAAIDHLWGNPNLQGVYNFCTPAPVTNRQLAQQLGRRLHRPSFFPTPSTLMRLLLGELSGMLLGSQRALPQALIESGFKFHYPTLEEALQAILKR